MTLRSTGPRHAQDQKIAIDTEPENTAFLSRRCCGYRAEEFRALKKIEISGEAGGATRSILATLVIVDDPSIVGPDELGLARIRSTDSVRNPANAIAVAPLLANALRTEGAR